MRHHQLWLRALIVGSSLLVACSGAVGPAGDPGPAGTSGKDGTNGKDGMGGKDGTDGTNGMNGMIGPQGPAGGSPLRPCLPSSSVPGRGFGVDQSAPLSGVIALTIVDPDDTGAMNLSDYVKTLVDRYAKDKLPTGFGFPLQPAVTDSVRTIRGVRSNVAAKWLDPLTSDQGPNAPRFGSNNDYIAWFGDGWNAIQGAPPQWNGSGSSGWMWVNQEYISNALPTLASAPTGQHLTYARFLRAMGTLSNNVDASVWSQPDLDTYVQRTKTQIGGSWVHMVQDPSTCEWSLDRGQAPTRYDGTSNTQIKVTGTATLVPEHDDAGMALAANVVPGTLGDCAGGQTPWGTVLIGEENTQDYYGDFEPNWDGSQKFIVGQGYDPGQNINPSATPLASGQLGRHSDPNQRHQRDSYGYIVEIDPGRPAGEYLDKTTPGDGHKKIGNFGRARWENASFAVDANWKLVVDKPIVVYAGDDRRGGRLFKWVSKMPYKAGMTKAQTRALLDDTYAYVAHFAGLNNATGITMLSNNMPPTEVAPGTGQWIQLSTTSMDVAPNATALGTPNKTVGDALKDVSWNGIGGFPNDDAVRRALFTACNKVGIMELNRPEDIEWNPKDPSGKPRLYVAFTNHTARVALDQNGKLFDPAMHAMMSPLRTDTTGSIFSLEEMDPANPATSKTFKFARLWTGSAGGGIFEAADPDNIVIDREGGVWFGTDGNFGATGKKYADAVYYLDLDATHKMGGMGIAKPSYGLAFRIASMPADAEATGPAFTSDQGTMFIAVQHPGEDNYSSWP